MRDELNAWTVSLKQSEAYLFANKIMLYNAGNLLDKFVHLFAVNVVAQSPEAAIRYERPHKTSHKKMSPLLQHIFNQQPLSRD